MADSVEARLARIEADIAIRQLAIRYAHAVDSRDIDSLVALFVDDAATATGADHAGVRARYEKALRGPYRTVHSVSNHLIELVDEDHARGRVYTRAEEEGKGSWCVRAMMYFDEYRRQRGQWLFAARETHYWYRTEFDRRPHAPGFMDPPDRRGRAADLPHLFPTFSEFWKKTGDDLTRLTDEP